MRGRGVFWRVPDGVMRILLAPEVDRAAVEALALAQGWRLVQALAQKDGRPRQLVFATAEGTELVTFVEDHRIDARYIVLAGHDSSAVAELVRLALPCLDERAVLAMLEQDRARAIAWLGVVAPERACEPILGILQAALESDEPAIREAARFAAEATSWPELGGRRGAAWVVPWPERPRLGRGVLARVHVTGGDQKVILHEPRTGTVIELDRPTYRILELADGTRDLDALALALAREGIYAGEAELVALVRELHDAGVLEDGIEAPLPAPPVARRETPLDRPLDVLEGYTFVCDGRGSCCRSYGSIAFTAADAMRARVVAESMELPIAPQDLFTPLSGAVPREDDVFAVAQIDGCCAFLERDGGCAIHRCAGAQAKPFPCRFYPAMLMDDGTSVRVSVGPECACVFASLGRTDGAPLVPSGARTLGDLPLEARVVMHVPDPVPLTPMRTASREALSRWSAELVRALAAREDVDAAALAWALSEVIEREGLEIAALARALGARPSVDAAAPWLAALGERAREVAAVQARWRSATDLSRGVAEWIAGALAQRDIVQLTASDPVDPAAERFYLRALAHGHRLAVEGRTLAHGLRDRAARILTARAMAQVEPPPHASARSALALLEAAMRALALSGYADELGS